MKRFLFCLFAAVIVVADASALDLFKKKNSEPVNYTAWRDTTALTTVNAAGLPIFLPETLDDGQAVVRGEIVIPGRSAEQIFLGALDYAVNHLDTDDGHEEMGEFNPGERSFLIRLYSKQGSTNTEAIYHCLALVKAEDGKLLFAANNIDVKYRDKGIIPRTQEFEKLKPADNNRHRELVEQFSSVISDYFYSMAESAARYSGEPASHWSEIRDKRVTPGMTELEVRLAIGQPVTTRKGSDRDRWIYPRNFVVLFENGKVVKVVE